MQSSVVDGLASGSALDDDVVAIEPNRCAQRRERLARGEHVASRIQIGDAQGRAAAGADDQGSMRNGLVAGNVDAAA